MIFRSILVLLLVVAAPAAAQSTSLAEALSSGEVAPGAIFEGHSTPADDPSTHWFMTRVTVLESGENGPNLRVENFRDGARFEVHSPLRMSVLEDGALATTGPDELRRWTYRRESNALVAEFEYHEATSQVFVLTGRARLSPRP